jgi:hypothetical protein
MVTQKGSVNDSFSLKKTGFEVKVKVPLLMLAKMDSCQQLLKSKASALKKRHKKCE